MPAVGVPGYGRDAVHLVVTNTNTNTGNTNITLPTSGTFTSPLYLGTLRVVTSTIGVNATCKVAAIFGTDASNVNNVFQIYGGDGAASPAGIGIDESFVLRPNTSLGTINIVVNVGTNNCVHDVYLSANPPRSFSY